MNMLKRFMIGATAASLSLGMMVAINAQDETNDIPLDTSTNTEVTDDNTTTPCPNLGNCNGLHDGTHQGQGLCQSNGDGTGQQNRHENGHHQGNQN